MTDRINNQKYDFYPFDEQNQLNMHNYVEFVFDERRRCDNGRHIGIFIFQINDSQLAFNLPDAFENQVILNIYLNIVYSFYCRHVNGSN